MRARAIDERHRLPHVDLLPEHDARFLLPRHFPGLNLLLGFPTWSHFSWLLCRWASRTISKLPCHPCGIDDRSPFWHCCPLLPREATPEYRPQRHSRRDCPARRLTPSVCRPLEQVGCHVSRPTRRRICPNRRRVKWLSASLPLLNRTVLPICSIEVSPHGDLLDEQKGSAAHIPVHGCDRRLCPPVLSEQAVWCTKCGQKYPFVSPRGCANEILFS